MITAGRLKKLLEQVPDGANVFACGREVQGLVMFEGSDYFASKNTWFIKASESDVEDTKTVGFNESEN